MKVLLTKKFQSSDIDYIKSRLKDGIELIEPQAFTEDGVVASIADVDVLLGGMLTEKVVEASKHIKLFQIPWTGVDTVDFQLLKKHKLDCVCNSHSNASVVAEHALALYFSAAKKIPYHDNQMRGGNWNRVSPDGNEVSPFSCTLSRQKIVFVGYGAVNRSVHQLLSGFDPVVSVVNRSGQLADSSDSVSVYSYDRIEQSLEGANAVFVAVPLTAETKGVFSESCFRSLNEQTILVNVARGSVVEEGALYRALAENSIYGAGIDTWYNYPKPAQSTQTLPSEKYPFHELTNFVMSPHRAGYVNSGFPHLDDAIKNLNYLNAGKPLINRLSVEHRY